MNIGPLSKDQKRNVKQEIFYRLLKSVVFGDKGVIKRWDFDCSPLFFCVLYCPVTVKISLFLWNLRIHFYVKCIVLTRLKWSLALKDGGEPTVCTCASTFVCVYFRVCSCVCAFVRMCPLLSVLPYVRTCPYVFLCTCVCTDLFLYVCTLVSVRISVHLCVRVSVYTCVRLCTCVCTSVHLRLYLCVLVCTYFCVLVSVRISVCTCLYGSVCTCLYVCVYLSIRVCALVCTYFCVHLCTDLCTCVYGSVGTCTYFCVYLSVRVYTCLYVSVYTCLYGSVCTCVCTYFCACVCTHSCPLSGREQGSFRGWVQKFLRVGGILLTTSKKKPLTGKTLPSWLPYSRPSLDGRRDPLDCLPCRGRRVRGRTRVYG